LGEKKKEVQAGDIVQWHNRNSAARLKPKVQSPKKEKKQRKEKYKTFCAECTSV
jgi:hypothetical protein